MNPLSERFQCRRDDERFPQMKLGFVAYDQGLHDL